MAPLTRKQLTDPQGRKISKRTVKAVTQFDIDKATKARDEALKSEAGRRTLARLGKVKADE
jgi:hypothetical protein